MLMQKRLDGVYPDPLDAALADLRVTGSVLLHEQYRDDWAIAVPDERGLRGLLGVDAGARVIPFHYVRHGGFDLSGAADEPLALVAGELSIVAGGGAHQLAAGRAVEPERLAEILGRARTAPSSDDTAGTTELICGCFVTRAMPLNPLLGALPPVFKVTAQGAAGGPALASIADLLAGEVARGAAGGFAAMRLVELLCGEAIRSARARLGDMPGWFRGLDDPRIGAALRRLHAEPDRAWTVAALASEVALSPSRFAARFREKVGTSVMSYLARWRATFAARLLRDTDLPLAEIAGRSGYENTPAFSRAFRSHVGASPAAWRRGGVALHGSERDDRRS